MSGLVSGLVGILTQAAQPAFLAVNSADDNDVTGDGTVFTVDFDTEIFDQNADFASDTFTAPVAGRYLLLTSVRATAIDNTADVLELSIVATNRSALYKYEFTNTLPTGPTSWETHIVMDMDAADTVTVTFEVTGMSKVVDIQSGGTSPPTHFSGHLVA